MMTAQAESLMGTWVEKRLRLWPTEHMGSLELEHSLTLLANISSRIPSVQIIEIQIILLNYYRHGYGSPLLPLQSDYS